MQHAHTPQPHIYTDRNILRPAHLHENENRICMHV